MADALTRNQVRSIDRIAIDQYGIPGIVLMENAGAGAARIICSLVPPRARIGILCGSGNNGGDGFVIARHLANAGHQVRIYLVADPARFTGDSKTNYQITQNMHLETIDLRNLVPLIEPKPPIRARSASRRSAGAGECPEPDHVQTQSASDCLSDLKSKFATEQLLIDALLGTGSQGPVRPPMDAIIEAANASGVPIIAIDIPAGLDCDTGQVEGIAIKAANTITFVGPKIGFAALAASTCTGFVHVVDIGAPRELITEALRRSPTD